MYDYTDIDIRFIQFCDETAADEFAYGSWFCWCDHENAARFFFQKDADAIGGNVPARDMIYEMNEFGYVLPRKRHYDANSY